MWCLTNTNFFSLQTPDTTLTSTDPNIKPLIMKGIIQNFDKYIAINPDGTWNTAEGVEENFEALDEFLAQTAG